MTPLELDAHSRSEGMTLGALRAALPADVFVRSPLRAWLGLAQAWAMVLGGEALLIVLHRSPAVAPFLRVPAMLALWCAIAVGMVGLFIIGHDCGHEAFSKRRWVNTLVGHACMSGILTGFHNWRVAHNHHHARAQLRKDDTDWPEGMLTLAEYDGATRRTRLHTFLAFATPAGLLVGFIVGMARRTFMRTLYPQVAVTARTGRKLLVSNLATLVVSGGITALVFVHAGALGVLEFYGVPVYLGMVLGALFTFLHHSGEEALVFDADGWTPFRGQMMSTFDVRFPRWFEVMIFHINRHLPHHLAPNIPYYHLPRATEAIWAACPELRRERRFSIGYLVRAWRAPLLERADGAVLVAARRR